MKRERFNELFTLMRAQSSHYRAMTLFEQAIAEDRKETADWLDGFGYQFITDDSDGNHTETEIKFLNLGDALRNKPVID